MIKYLGSKRRLVPVLGAVAAASGASSALDLFTGTTRVAQEFKRQGLCVTAVDVARYAEQFGLCYIATDADQVDYEALEDAIASLNGLAPRAGYFTETFCIQSRFFQPFNGERIDVIRDAIEAEYSESDLYPLLLTSLIEAADRVDSTAGQQMAYIKQWASRSARPLELVAPLLVPGPGFARRGDAVTLAPSLGSFDLAYLDPPYNQHRYFTNYHVWETLVAWDAPEHYGVACKRIDARDPETHSPFNAKRSMPEALRSVISSLDCELLVLSYNDESWLDLEDLEAMCGDRAEIATLAFDSSRYVGARIGIYNPAGEKVGKISHLVNQEYVVIAGPHQLVTRVTEAHKDAIVPVTSEPREAV